MAKTVLIFIDWYYPGFLAGGPVQSVLSLTNALAADFKFKIITSNADLGKDSPYPDIEYNKWLKVLNAEVIYLDKAHQSYSFLKSILKQTDFDTVYFNSLFSVKFSILPIVIARRLRLNKRMVIAPRGMLGEGALQIKSLKKKLFLFACNALGFHKGLIWHATSEQEVLEIKNRIKHVQEIELVANFPKDLSVKNSVAKSKDQLNLFFFSRISRKKQLHYALDVLTKPRPGKINFSIYGPVEDDEYWKECEERIRKLPSNVHTKHKGPLQPHEIVLAFSEEHVMILPTLNENFGHSIVESLFCGCPVIISNNTPWNDLEKKGAGFAIPLENPEEYQQAINAYLAMDMNEFSACRVRSVDYIRKKVDLGALIKTYRAFFNES